MTWHYITYFTSTIITAVVMALIAWYSRLKRNDMDGAGVYMWIALLVSILSIFQGISIIGPTDAWALFWFNMRVACFAAIPVFWLIFVLHFTGKQALLSKTRIALLFIIPFITQVILWTNDWHGLWVVRDVAFNRAGPFFLPVTSMRVPGPWYGVHMLYTNGMMLTGFAILFIAAMRMPRHDQGQALILGAGTLVMVIGALVPTLNLVPGMTLNPLPQSFALGSLIIAWGLYRHRFLARTPRIDPEKTIPVSLVSLFLVLTAGIIASGFFYYSRFREQHRAGVERQLSSIADLKVEELVQWRKERLGDGATLYRNYLFNRLVRSYFSNPQDETARWQIYSFLGKIQTAYAYRSITLLDPGGVIRMTVPGSDALGKNHVSKYIDLAGKTGNVAMSDFHREKPDGPIHLSVITPLSDEPGGAPFGFVVLIIDPALYLYPRIVTWPVPSRSAETLLVRREGGDTLFLNELRFRKNTALNFRIPLTRTATPAVMAVLGKEGVVDGIDYRGVPVVAALRAVPGSPWYLVARMDAEEVYAPVQERFWEMILLVAVLVIGAGSGVGYLWRRQGERHIRERLDAAEALRESERKLREARKMAQLGYWYWDVNTGVVEWSEEVYNIFCLNQTEFTPTIDSILALSPWPEDHERDKELIRKAMESHGQGDYEQRFLRPDKSIGYYYSTFQGRYNEEGELVSIIGSIMDITERKRAEDELRSSEKRFRSLFENMLNGFAYCKMLYEDGMPADFIYLDINTAFESLTGLKNAKGKKVSDVIPGIRNSDPQLFEIYGRVAKTGKPETFETYVVALKMWFSISVYSPGEDHFVAVFEVITARKRAEEELRRSEEKYRELIQNANSAIIRWGIDGTVTFFNEFAQSFFGYAADEAVGRHVSMLVPDIESTGRDLSGLIREIAEKPDHFLNNINENVCKDGRRVWMLWTNKPIFDENGEIVEILAVGSDITERKRAEDSLKTSHRFLQIVHSQQELSGLLREFVSGVKEYTGCSAVGIRILDENGGIPYQAYDGFTRVFFEKESPLSIKTDKCMCINVIKGTTDPALPFYTKGGSFYMNGTTRFLAAVTEKEKGETRNICNQVGFESVALVPIRQNDRIIGLIHMADTREGMVPLDNVEVMEKEGMQLGTAIMRLKAEEEVRTLNLELEKRVLERTAQLEEAGAAIKANALRIEDLYNRAPCGYHSLDENGVFVEINDTELEWLGYRREEVIGKKYFKDIITVYSQQVFEENFPKYKERGFVNDLEFDIIRKDGTVLPVLASATAIKDADGRFVRSRSTVIDFREVKQAREDMARYAARLEEANKELESFSYSVSHDLRAPLRTIDGFSQAVLEDYADRIDEKGKDYLQRLRAASQRMGRLIDDILRLSRIGRSELARDTVDLSAMANSIARRLAAQEPNRAVGFNIQDNMTATGDVALLSVALENLLGNALKFTSTRAGAVIEFVLIEMDGERVYAVRDNGVGFDMRYADKLFVPFQRLHGADEFEGTGIGLSLVKRIITRHGGKLWAESEAGKGTTIYFTLK